MSESGERFQSVWSACPAEELLWACWPDGATVYHRPSGKTHRLNRASIELMHRLQQGSCTVLEAATDLAVEAQTEPSAEYIAAVEAVLFRLGQWGIASCIQR